MTEQAPKPMGFFEKEVETVVNAKQIDETYFSKAGEVTVSALVRRDISALDTLYDSGLSKPVKMPGLTEDVIHRLMGNQLLVAAGLNELKNNKNLFQGRSYDRGDTSIEAEVKTRHKATEVEFKTATDALIEKGDKYKFAVLAKHAADAILLADIDDLKAGSEALKKVTEDVKSSPIIRAKALGMLDVVKPAVERTKMFSSIK